MSTLSSDWVGEYATATKWGGVSGTWNPASNMVINTNGDIFMGTLQLQNVVTSENGFSWSNAGDFAGSITFANGSPGDGYYFDSVVNGNIFYGQYNPLTGGSGGLDFRGMMANTPAQSATDQLDTLLDNFGEDFNLIYSEDNPGTATGSLMIGGFLVSITFTHNALTNKWTGEFSLTMDINSPDDIFTAGVEIQDGEFVVVLPLSAPIDLGPIQLAGPPPPAAEVGSGGAPTGGAETAAEEEEATEEEEDIFEGPPEVELAFTPGEAASLSFNTGINFFNTQTIATQVTVAVVSNPDTGGTEVQLTANLRTPEFLGTRLSLTLEYTKSGGLAITGMPVDMELVDNSMTLWNKIKTAYEEAKAAGTGTCQAITETLVNNTIYSTFALVPTFSPTDTGMNVSITGTLRMVIGVAPAAYNIDYTLSPLSIDIPSDTSFGEIAAVIADGIFDSLATNLFDNQAELTKLLTALYGPSFAAGILAKMVCAKPSMSPAGPPGGLFLPIIPISIPGSGPGSDPEILPAPVISQYEYNDTTNMVDVSWNAITNATGYRLEIVRFSTGIVGATFSITPGTTTTFSFTNIPMTGYGNYVARVIATSTSASYTDSIAGVSANKLQLGS